MDPRAVPPNVNAGTPGPGSRAVCLSDLFLPFAGRRAPRTGLRSVSAWVAALAAGLVLALWLAVPPAQAAQQAPAVKLGKVTQLSGGPAVPAVWAIPGPGAGQIRVIWEPGTESGAPAVTSWQVRVVGGASSGSLAATTRGHTFTGLTSGTAYSIRLSAIARVGGQDKFTHVEGSVTAGVAAFTQSVKGRVNLSLEEGGTACADCPVTPTGYADPGPGPGEITVRWAPGVDTRTQTVPVTKWKPARSNLGGQNFGAGNPTLATRSWVFLDLVPGQEYKVYVQALEADEDTPTIISAVVRAGAAVPVEPQEPPDAPSGITVSGSQVSGPGKLKVSWTAPNDNGSAITDYDLRIYEGSADPTDEADWIEDDESTSLPSVGTATEVEIPGLDASTTYRVQVRAANAGGEGPWSVSGSSTVGTYTGTNNAPKAEAAFTCAQIAMPALIGSNSIASGVAYTASLTRGTRACSSHGLVGLIDPDGDDLFIKITGITTSGDNVVHLYGPTVTGTGLTYGGASKYGGTGSTTVSLRVTDDNGASADTTYRFDLRALAASTSAPTFNGTAGLLEFTRNVKGSAVLPPATGGDVQAVAYTIPYDYKVTGLPPGLTFDKETRTVSGTSTAAGTWTATYIADDADSLYSQKDSPTAADTADAATQTFTVRVAASGAAAPTIGEVRIVSRPTHDADGNGTFDTYIAGDEILVDVEYSEPVAVTASALGDVRLRLDLGTDDTNLGNSRDVMKLKQVLNGGRTLRFAYTVAAGPGTRTCSSTPKATDCDADGIWVQTSNLTSNFNMMFLANDAKVRSAATGVDASRERAGLTTSGDAGHKVDGGRTSVAGPVPDADVPATVKGSTLTVTFDKALHTSVDTSRLMYHLSIHGAGDVSGGNRNADQHPHQISIGGTDNKVLTLGLYEAVQASDVVTLSYSGDSNLLRTATGNHAAPGFRDLAVANITAGAVGPLPQHASAAGKSLRIVFDQDLDTGSLPAGNAFRVFTQDFDGDTRNIGGAGTVSVQGNTVMVGLAAAVRTDEIASVSYTPPATGKKLQDATYFTAAKAFSGFKVEAVEDISAPTLSHVVLIVHPTLSTQTRAFIYFEEALDTSSTPAPADFAIKCCIDLGQENVLIRVPYNIQVLNNAVVLDIPQDSTPGTTKWKFAYTPGTNPIRDLAGNAAAKIAERDMDVLSTASSPGLQGINVNGATVSLQFSEYLDPHSVPAASAFTFHDPDGTTERSIGIAGTRVEGSSFSSIFRLYLDHPVQPCAGATPFKVSYTVPGTNPIQGLGGSSRKAAAIDKRAVTNGRASNCSDGRNWLSHMTIGSVVIRANRPFATDKPPKPGWFTVTASGGPVTVTGAAFDPNDAHVLKLTLSREFAAGETVTASYRRPAGEAGLWDVDGNQLGDVTDWPVRAKAGLTASFHGLPDTHDGRKLFAFEIRFSEEFQGMRLTALKRALQVTGGRLIDVKRTVRGQNKSVTARVRPSRSGDVTLSLPATTDCSAADATCTQDGRKLSAVSASVSGPDSAAAAALPALSVADARAAEGGDLGFAVTLDVAATGEVTVDYATSDGTATSGADYTAATGTLTFAAGETAKTVSVALLRDADTEADETLTLTLSGASGATIGSASATGTVANAAPPADTVPPAPESAEVDGHIATVTFDEDLAPASAQWFNFQWTITGTGAQHHPDSAWIADERTVKLRLAQNFPAVAGQTVMLKYEPSDYLRDAAGNQVAFFHMVAENLTLPVLTVDDARAAEGTDATLDFTVRMNAAVEGTVTVDYATSDGTAKAGEDYTVQSGTLTFAPGDTEKTVSVPILDDALDEGSETFTLRLSNAGGARIGDGEATGTIENSDPLQTMWLSRFGRTVADHVAGAVSDRLSNPMTGAQVTVGGQNLDLANMEDEAWLDRTMLSMARVLGVPDRSGPGDDGWPDTGLGLHESPSFGSAPVRSITGREILLGSSFHLAGDGEGTDSGMAAWGRVTTGGFDGEAPADMGTVRIDGEVTTGILGADAKWGRVLAGVALSVSEGEGTFDQPGVDSGTIESTMTTGSPYARVELNDRISAWGMAGLGTGDMTIVQQANTATNQPERITRTDLSLRMAAVGGRGALMTSGQTGGMDLALRADAFLVQTESEAVSGEGSTKADASRVRLILEGSSAFQTGDGVLTPGLELGLRHDGGDAETGTGVELGGRIAYVNPATGLSLEANVRALVAHEDSGYEEWGASGALRLVPGDRGRGLSFSLAPTYGAPGSGVERLWSARDAGGLASGGSEFDPESRIEGEIGYGLPAFGDRYTGTPNIGFGLSDGGSREYRLGWRLARAGGGSSGSFGSFALSLDATRSEPADNNDSGSGTVPKHAIVLRAGVRW